MDPRVAGQKIVDCQLVVDPAKLDHLEAALGTVSAASTALMLPFFAATAAGQDSVVGALGMDLSRALQGGQSFEWHRPFRPGETVHLQVVVADLFRKAAYESATVVAEFRASDGDLIQRQQIVFVERAAR